MKQEILSDRVQGGRKPIQIGSSAIKVVAKNASQMDYSELLLNDESNEDDLLNPVDDYLDIVQPVKKTRNGKKKASKTFALKTPSIQAASKRDIATSCNKCSTLTINSFRYLLYRFAVFDGYGACTRARN